MTELLDRMFSDTFGREKFDVPTEFAFIAMDYFKRVYPDVEKYSPYLSDDDSSNICRPCKDLKRKIIYTMLIAARQGNDPAREILCRLYKVYYKREYNQIKRFDTLSYDEILSFVNEKEAFGETAARIMTIGPLMGIDLQSDCNMINAKLETEKGSENNGLAHEKESKNITIDQELLQSACEEAKGVIERQHKKGDSFDSGSVARFRNLIYGYLHVLDESDPCRREEIEPSESSIAVTIALLRRRFRNKLFTDEEILLYHEIYRQTKEYSGQIQDLNMMSEIILGNPAKYQKEAKECRYQPEKQKVVTPSVRCREENVTNSGATEVIIKSEAEKREKELEKEVDDLKTLLKQKQQKLEEAQKQYLKEKEEARKNRKALEQWETDKCELFRLREYVYSLTEEDVEITSVSLEEMKEDLKRRKIIIVGGHDNWVGYLKEIFPYWTYIKPSISNTLPEIHAINAEYLFFFTDTISHGSFDKYMNIVKKHNLQYSYLHGTNIDRTISNVYKEVTGKKRIENA